VKLRANAFNPCRPEFTANDWYWSKRWKKRRARQLQREPLCAMCLAKKLTRPATVADHIEDWQRPLEPHGDWGRFITGQLQSLCRGCHELKHGRRREQVQIGEDGWPVETPAQ
jgi:hypothetical protein